jgi:putative ABC transport system permease protein
VVLAFAIFGLVFVGLVAVAGFAVLAQRRLRALGMLASLGATDKAVRLVLLANGAVVGVVGAGAGTVLGLAAWIGYAPRFSISVHHTVAWTHLPWWLTVSAPLLAIATAVLAAYRPARAVSRLSVMAALSGRPAAGHPAHRSAVPGAVLLPVGLIMIALSGGWGSTNTTLQLGGLLITAVGLLLLAPIGVALLGRAAGGTPLASRLALRDLARYRTRSGPALAAVSFAVFTAVVIVLLSGGRLADPVDYAGPNLPANQLLLRPDEGPGPGAGPGGPGQHAQPTPLDPAAGAATAQTIAAALGTTDMLPLQDTGLRLGQGLRGDPGTIWLATPEVLRHYRIDPASIKPDTVLLSSRHGLDSISNLVLFAGRDHDPYQHPKVQLTDALPTGAS